MLPLETSLREGDVSDDGLRRHHPGANLPQQQQQQQQQQQPLYHCPFCAKPFNAKWMLERHLPSHTGQRPYKCVRCERRFSLQSSAVRHVKNVHRGEDGFDAEAEASSMVIKDVAGGGGGLAGGGLDAAAGSDGTGGVPGVIDAGENQIVIG